jgi:hypothetical protein
MSVVMGVASPYWLRSIEPGVTSTIERVAGAVKAQAQKHAVYKTAESAQASVPAVNKSGDTSPVQNDSATGGQK